jgi:hypothetical protein
MPCASSAFDGAFMKRLRAATLTVASVPEAVRRYSKWFDYRTVEDGEVAADLARAWGCERSAGRRYAVLGAASGAPVYLRFVEGVPDPGFRALRTHGWSAIELCVRDVQALAEELRGSPFEILGAPRENAALPAILPMQVRGPDQEMIYLTEIRGDLPAIDLPRAATAVDALFILVLGCRDLDASCRWFERQAGLQAGETLEIRYTMIARAFSLPEEQRHRIRTMVDGRDVALELDQNPPAATARRMQPGTLAPGISIGTFIHGDLDRADLHWIAPPVKRSGPLYAGRRAGTVIAPDAALVELVEG